jgi:hypothetical protein
LLIGSYHEFIPRTKLANHDASHVASECRPATPLQGAACFVDDADRQGANRAEANITLLNDKIPTLCEEVQRLGTGQKPKWLPVYTSLWFNQPPTLSHKAGISALASKIRNVFANYRNMFTN